MGTDGGNAAAIRASACSHAVASSRTRYNGQMTSRQIRQFCKLSDECQELLRNSVNEMGLSARAHDKVLRVSRTIADLDNSEAIANSLRH